MCTPKTLVAPARLHLSHLHWGCGPTAHTLITPSLRCGPKAHTFTGGVGRRPTPSYHWHLECYGWAALPLGVRLICLHWGGECWLLVWCGPQSFAELDPDCLSRFLGAGKSFKGGAKG